jgi:TonB family protein
MRTIARLGVALVLVSGLSAGLAAQDLLSEAKGLYDSASYSEALSALNRVASAADLEQVEKYRALCFLALDQPKDAEQALEHLAISRPLFTLDGADASPRLVALFRDVRRRTLPAAAMRIYQRAKAGFDSGDLAEASRQFKDVVALADAAPQEQAALMGDLKMLAVGFLLLTEMLGTKPDAPAAPAAAAPAPGASGAVASIEAPAADLIYDASSVGVKPPAVITQTIPSWIRTPSLRSFSFKGALEVIVSEQGTVVSATMSQPIHNEYDRILLSAARKWRFEPATDGGRPVKYHKTYPIVVEPSTSR